MILSRRGIVSLPIRLTISLMIIALMVPPITALSDSIQDGIGEQEVSDAAEMLKDSLSAVYSKGPSYVLHTELSIPRDCHLAIGGENRTAIRMFAGDEYVGQLLTDIPVHGDEMILYGDVLLEISNVTDGDQMVAVKEL